MLHEFLSTNRAELEQRCRTKTAMRGPAQLSEQVYGVPMLLTQLIATLRADTSPSPQKSLNIGDNAKEHGRELLQQGFSVDQVVHSYGDLCQATTELAQEHATPILVDEFHTFNRCLDDAIAAAVAEFVYQRDRINALADADSVNERVGFLLHEVRNSLNTATLAVHAIKNGGGALNGATGAVLDRSLRSLQTLVDRSLSDVRLTAGLQAQHETIFLGGFVEDLRVAAELEANKRGIVLDISVEENLAVEADRHMLSSAVTNLLQNAFKFTRPATHVSLAVRSVADYVVIEIEDECGGLLVGKTETLFNSFEQRSVDRSGLGLGLSISRRAVQACGGKLRVQNAAGVGCIFAIELPRMRLD